MSHEVVTLRMENLRFIHGQNTRRILMEDGNQANEYEFWKVTIAELQPHHGFTGKLIEIRREESTGSPRR